MEGGGNSRVSHNICLIFPPLNSIFLSITVDSKNIYSTKNKTIFMLMLFAGGEKNGTKKHFNRQNIATPDFAS